MGGHVLILTNQRNSTLLKKMSAKDASKVEELTPSKLGTKEYWEEAYNKEVENFAEIGDPGEAWFGEEAAARMVNWLADHPELVAADASVLDVGCGNGLLTVDLAKEGFQVVGVDYCEAAIKLAKQVAEQADLDLDFQECDILEDLSTSQCTALKKTYNVVVDRGTFDAISLGEKAVEDKKSYMRNMGGLLKPEGLLLITSCNWTEEELRAQFSEVFLQKYVLPTPSFTFGGVRGNTVTAVVFQKT